MHRNRKSDRNFVKNLKLSRNRAWISYSAPNTMVSGTIDSYLLKLLPDNSI